MPSNPLAHVVPFASYSPQRCYQLLSLEPRRICGLVANWRRPGLHWIDDRFFCDAHRAIGDEPAAGEIVCRRVSVEAVFRLVATDLRVGGGNAGVLAQLEALVEAAGGLLDVHGVHSVIGRMPAPRLPGKAIGAPNGREWPPLRH